MKKFYEGVLSATCCAALLITTQAKAIDLTDLDAKQGYSIGYQLGGDFKAKEISINPEALLAGVADAMSGHTPPALSQDQMAQVLMDLRKRVDEKRRALVQKAVEENKAAEVKFLVENGAKEGVTTLPSGLQYKIVKEGDGPKPSATSSVTVNYRGTLPDGSEFDSSYKSGKPASFPVNRVIAGWTEALQLMQVGSKWTLYVPAALAYGERGAAPMIGPNQLLIFEVELLSIE